ncbi:DUF3850 domain-containing protein [Citrobacter portucalensis]|uniref:DUF3850 domain-containing protein n=1 Tax=Citrobacter portucalensis TaxID=1639133 RepID=UPI0034DD6FE1
MIHHLKIYPEHFSAVCTGIKRAELRKNDRDFKVGDTLHLMETPKGSCNPTGEFINTVVTHIADVGEWLPGYVMLSIERESGYAAPQLPQPAGLSVPEGVLKGLLPDAEKPDFWFEHNGKIFFEGVKFNNAVFEACRAARLQASNSPVTPDGWVACSERMPEGMTDVHISNGHDVGQGWWDGDTWQTQHDYYSVPGDVTHWLSLPAAPQQEVKSALEHGMRRYAGAMQKLSEGDD